MEKELSLNKKEEEGTELISDELTIYERVKSKISVFLTKKENKLLDNFEKIGYDEIFFKKALASSGNDLEKLSNSIITIINVRAKFYENPEPISQDFIKSSLEDNFLYFFGKTKVNTPTLILKVRKSNPLKQSVEERISFGFFIFETGMAFAKSNGVHQISIIYDRDDYEQEKHFDQRIPKALSSYHDANLMEIMIDWLENIYIINLSYFYKMMFEVYKVFAKKTRYIEKVKILSSKKDLLQYFEKSNLDEELH